ncbi:hypothetical protein EV421DRAFT_108940 [Armillaria borealis]|uniref:Uncharacterized protein n=1 Tax=Armillaria borealis TaxID=47425 RepID=A0AA39JSC1_9AGAR|nr:hypothetical protein EV421DRAFT_108940 [Armillaria borealis]
MQQRTDHRDHHPSPPSQGIKGAHIHDTTASPSFFPSPTISAFSPLPSSRPRCPPTTNDYTSISTGPLVAHNWPTIPQLPSSPTSSLPRPRLSQRKLPKTYSTKTRTDLSEPLSTPQKPVQSWFPPWKSQLQRRSQRSNPMPRTKPFSTAVAC